MGGERRGLRDAGPDSSFRTAPDHGRGPTLTARWPEELTNKADLGNPLGVLGDPPADQSLGYPG